MNRLWTFCEQLRRRSAACGSGTILQLSCYSSAHNPHPPSLYHHHHKQLLVIMHWLGRLSSCPSSADWRRKSNVVFKTFISCGSEKNVCHRQPPHNKDPTRFCLNQRWASRRERRRVVCSNCIEPMWSYLAPAQHTRAHFRRTMGGMSCRRFNHALPTS